MSTKYEVLYKKEEELYSEGAPIIVKAYALYKTGDTQSLIAQIKFQNISNQTIKAIDVTLKTYNYAEEKCDDVVYSYLDVSGSAYKDFGDRVAIKIDNTSVRSYDVLIDRVVFENNDIWNSGSDWNVLSKPTVKSGDSEFLKQYRLELNSSAKYEFCEEAGIWRCPCGSWNKYSVCHNCSLDKSKANPDDVTIEKSKEERISNELEKKELADKEKQLRIKKIKKNTAFLGCAVALLIIIGIILYKYTKEWRPTNLYSRALELIQDENYDRAKEILTRLNGKNIEAEIIPNIDEYIVYCDSGNLYKENDYLDALDKLNSCTNIEDICSIRQKCEDGITADIYENAEMLFNDQEYEKAINEYLKIQEYKDSNDKIEESHYRNADNLFVNGDYESALHEYEQILNYKDSEEKSIECNYQMGLYYMSIQSYGGAITRFSMYPEYKDCKELCDRALMLQGDDKFSDGKYSEALEFYEDIVNPSPETKEKMKKCIDIPKYELAVDDMSRGELQEALGLLMLIDEYENSEELIELCRRYAPYSKLWKCTYAHQFWGGSDHDFESYGLSKYDLETKIYIDENGDTVFMADGIKASFDGTTFKWEDKSGNKSVFNTSTKTHIEQGHAMGMNFKTTRKYE